ncbi:MAG: ribokinase [Bacteroidota bacterium]
MERKKITVIGSYNVGLFLKGKDFPKVGETIIADQFLEGGGGKGSNQAVAAAKFGTDTRFIGRLGADKYGLDALKMYNDFSISTDMIKIDATTHSGISIMLIDSSGDNLISIVPGANFNLSTADIDSAEEVLKESMIVGFQLENNFDVVEYGIRKVHELGVPVYLDPAPARKLPDDIYPCIDIIKPNETEAYTLSGIEVKDRESAVEAGRWFLERGVKSVLVTLGEQGAVLVNSEGSEYFPAPEVEAIDTTGAGDIFSGAFFYALQQGKEIREAIEFAIMAASLSATRLGVIESIPEMDEIHAFINENREK